jgi:hypothetical protein
METFGGMMNAAEIYNLRLVQQGLAQKPFHTPEAVVSWLGAVQAQDYPGTKWALGMRMQTASDETIELAFNQGDILRTHIMRPTWHFVTPADIRWLLELTAARVNAQNAFRYRQLELDEAVLRRSSKLIAKTFQGGKNCTRQELGEMLAAAGIAPDGQRIHFIMMRAELDGVVCSGPLRGKQYTYALLDERVPPYPKLSRADALAELTQRYFTGHGPATVRDFCWWSGLTTVEANAGLEIARLSKNEINGQVYYYSQTMQPAPEAAHEAFLLPTYDEYLVGYANFAKSRSGPQDNPRKDAFDPRILHNGQIIGAWRRIIKKETVVIEIAPFYSLSSEQKEAIEAGAQRYGKYIDRSVQLLFL